MAKKKTKTPLFDAFVEVVTPLWENKCGKSGHKTPQLAAIWTLCYFEARNIMQNYSTKDLASDLFDSGGVRPMNTPELCEANILTWFEEQRGDVLERLVKSGKFKEDEGWKSLIEATTEFWKN